MALTQIPLSLANELYELALHPVVLIALILAIFIFLGTFLDGFAMMVLILPIVLPIIQQSGIDKLLGIETGSDLIIWFGVIMVIVLEMALISPPVGMNVFVVKSVSEIPIKDIYKGIIPFWIAMFVCLIIITAFPQLSLYLPSTMNN